MSGITKTGFDHERTKAQKKDLRSSYEQEGAEVTEETEMRSLKSEL
jgi:hypothetical protein